MASHDLMVEGTECRGASAADGRIQNQVETSSNEQSMESILMTDDEKGQPAKDYGELSVTRIPVKA